MITGILVFLYLLGIGGLAFVASCEAVLAPYGEIMRPEIAERRSQFPRWLQQPRHTLVLFVVGRALFVVLSGIMAFLLAARIGGWWGGGVAAIGFLAIPVAGELLPRARFRQPSPAQIERATRWFDRFQSLFLGHLARLVGAGANQLVRFLGGEPLLQENPTGPESFQLDEGDRRLAEELAFREQKMIQAISEIGETVAREVMVPRTAMECLDVNATLPEVLDKVTTCLHSRIPVYEEDADHIIGILHVKDLFEVWQSREGLNVPVEGAGSGAAGRFDLRRFLRPAQFVPETKKIRELFAEFQREKTHIAIVVDEYGGTAGLVTLEDFLEEIVGEIQDEFDEEPVPYEQEGDGVYIVDGTMHTDDVRDELGLGIPDSEDYDTVSGFILSRLGEVPPVGEVIEHEGLRLTVVAGDERRIERVRLERIPGAPEPGE